MTEPDKIPDTMLMALADNELAEPEAGRVRAAIARDPELARQFEQLRATRRLLAGLHGQTLREPVPERLLAAVQRAEAATRPQAAPAEATVLPLRPRPARAAVQSGWRGLAIAASVALVLGGVVGFGLGRMDGQAPAPLAGLPDPRAAAALAGALERTPSGGTLAWPGGQLVIRHSHPTPAGPCRDFVLGGTGGELAGLACRGEGGWTLRLAVQRGAGAGDATRPASGEDPLVQEMLDRIEAGAPLDAAAERAAIARGWR